MPFFVYVIQSEVNGQLYKGLTSSVEKRLKEHNAGRSFSTKPYRPWRLVYVKEFDNRISAREYEKFLKTGVGREYLKNILEK